MASVLILLDNKLILNLLFQLCYMGNNPDEFRTARHFLKHSDCLVSGVLIQRTEAFVDEHRLKPCPAAP